MPLDYKVRQGLQSVAGLQSELVHVSPFLVTVQPYLSSKFVHYVFQKVAIANIFIEKI